MVATSSLAQFSVSSLSLTAAFALAVRTTTLTGAFTVNVISAPEVIVNTESNYFKWKKGEEIKNPFKKKEGGNDESGK